MSKFASKQFWLDAGDRVLATVAQAGLAYLGAGIVGILEIDWIQLASVAGLAGFVSLLTSIALRGGATGVGIDSGFVDGTSTGFRDNTRGE